VKESEPLPTHNGVHTPPSGISSPLAISSNANGRSPDGHVRHEGKPVRAYWKSFAEHAALHAFATLLTGRASKGVPSIAGQHKLHSVPDTRTSVSPHTAHCDANAVNDTDLAETVEHSVHCVARAALKDPTPHRSAHAVAPTMDDARPGAHAVQLLDANKLPPPALAENVPAGHGTKRLVEVLV
jgi:hypothetical protein